MYGSVSFLEALLKEENKKKKDEMSFSISKNKFSMS